jgi:hypothetical protein
MKISIIKKIKIGLKNKKFRSENSPDSNTKSKVELVNSCLNIGQIFNIIHNICESDENN